VVVARPVATLCGELLAAAVPAVLVPRKVREDGHDWFNAQAMETVGAAAIAPCAVLGGTDTIGSDDEYELEFEYEEGHEESAELEAEREAARKAELGEALARYGPGGRGLRRLQTERLLLGLLEDEGKRDEMRRRAAGHAVGSAARIIAEALVEIVKDPASDDVVVLRRYARDAVLPWLAKAAKAAEAEKARTASLDA
jgi:UDP-N-acetylglucosamine:LPS N-acetylglucosamine transferase